MTPADEGFAAAKRDNEENDEMKKEEIFMTTAEKRKYIEHNYPALWDSLNHKLETGEIRSIDSEMQEIEDTWVLQYTITWLCDELVLLTKEV